jgi:hypothetical protein
MVGYQAVLAKYFIFLLVIIMTGICAAALCFFASTLVSVTAIATLIVSMAYVFFMVFGGFLRKWFCCALFIYSRLWGQRRTDE